REAELIEAAEGAGSFLEEAPLSMAGRRIGPYRLTGELGEGGMGVVYLAERVDQAFEQKVAVKVLRRGLESTEMQARFRRERQILARLEHPNIARILDGGTTEDGVPWLGMELVDGEPIDQWCDQRRLSVDERLRLFQKVCAAVDYAHRNLVVHRDLKPSNILVTDAGEPKLLDFGIAKVLLEGSDLSETRSGPTAMTPRYASPEQVRGQSVTTASDVYTLGVILYELLTGQAPYTLKTAQPAELERVIGQELPAAVSVAVLRAGSSTPTGESPARLARRLRGDLDTILEKALAKEPERRYASVQQLQEDLDRHLGGLPVLARRDSRGYRLGRFVQRNLPWVITGSAFMIFLLAAVVVLSLQTQQLRAER
ncbi:MAG TPA: serine/threonine-protein kinase, partial [Myxococcota bacterium]|nr:serine/threonine-protein kinase [Myxococcota bacterium]